MTEQKSNYDMAVELLPQNTFGDRAQIYALLAIADAINAQGLQIPKADPENDLAELKLGTSIRLGGGNGNVLYNTTEGWMTATGLKASPHEILECGYEVTSVPC